MPYCRYLKNKKTYNNLTGDAYRHYICTLYGDEIEEYDVSNYCDNNFRECERYNEARHEI